ncbi:MAG: lipase family protein [Acidimicrobiales bacterium]
MRVLAVAASLGAVGLLLAACGSSTPSAERPLARGNGPGGTALANFPASQDFYRLPAHVTPETPGTLFRVQTISTSGGVVTMRVMYHSLDAAGHDALVTGLVTYPTGPAPSGGWPVIAWDHGTNGLNSSCAPSRTGGPGSVPTFGVRGVGVATDFQGEGPEGQILPYLNRATEAESTVDIVRAARQIPDAHASSRWVVVGDSEGGHAALATGELAPTYAPELHLLGTVAIGPGVLLSQFFPGDTRLVYDVVETMAVYGAHAANSSLSPAEVMLPAAQGVASVIDTQCVNQVAAYLGDLYLKDGGHLFSTPPLATPQGKAWIRANDIPQIHTDSPVLVVGGGQDPIAVPARVGALMPRLCALGDRASIDWYPTANHSTEVTQGAGAIEGWIKARLAGKQAPTSCPYHASSTPTTSAAR